jgi:DNA-binding HxlR family transcriptional regulator
MKRTDKKSHCPINYSLEIFWDAWSMLILRDIMISWKSRYKEFLASEERISTNILANRLWKLESEGIIQKINDQYVLTQKWKDIAYLLIEMTIWWAKHDSDTILSKELVEIAKNNPNKFRLDMKKELNKKDN